MHSRIFHYLNALVTFVLLFTLAMPVTAFADDGQPGDPTPEATEEASTEGSIAEEASIEETAPAEVSTEQAISEEPTPTEETIPAEPTASEESVAEVVEALVEADSVLVDENGTPVSLVSEEIVEAIANTDPWFDVGGGVVVGYSSAASCAAIVTECHANLTNPIQSAINDARSTGGTIHIEAGTYSEQIVITKSLTLLGNSGAVINSPVTLTNYTIGSGTRIYPLIYANGGTGSEISVTISGLTLNGLNYGSGNTGRDLVGIAYYNASGVISNNIIQNFTVETAQTGDGIYIRNTTGVNINGNTITNNERGIFVRDLDTVIHNNNIYNNSGPGVTENVPGTTPVNAENNYWGCVPVFSGGRWIFPAGCENVGGQIDRTPPLTTAAQVQTDTDGDTVFDLNDNCVSDSNLWQEDQDDDGVGDVCDDSDGDGVVDATDNCVAISNPSQTDTDGDGGGDACDADDDGDGIDDDADNCELVSNPGQEDYEGDGIGDVCDPDDDNDGVNDATDNCVFDANPGQQDNDMDGAGDVCDSDDDNDGVGDGTDNCQAVVNPGQEDKDHDGVGNACDPFPADAKNDQDNDGLGANEDNCPQVYNPNQLDSDNDGRGNACDGTPNGGHNPSILPAGLVIPVTGGNTLYLDAGFELDTALAEWANNQLPLDLVDGNYEFTCVVETVTTFDEGITVGGETFNAVGQCSYLANGLKQTITLGLPEGYTPGLLLQVSICNDELEHNEFAASGDPAELGNFLVPCSGLGIVDDLTS